MLISKSGGIWRGALIALCVFTLGLALSGCSPADGRLPVSGVVICDGEPLEGANIAFVGGGGGSFGTASTDSSGRFSLRAVPGVNKISVSAMDMSKADEWAEIPEEDTLMGDEAEQREAMKNMPKPLVAQRYFNSDTSGLEVTVEAGMEEVTLEVTAQD